CASSREYCIGSSCYEEPHYGLDSW
nr:immunoglobulin heavy chain junction region [Macaca mulatta]